MEADVAYVNSRSQRHTKGLDRAVQVLVIQSVFIVPDSRCRIGHFVAHEPDTIITGVGLDLVHGRACICPGHDSRLHPNRWGKRRKREACCTAHAELAVGHVVVHVAFAGMCLAPRVFVRANVCRFGKIGGTLVEVCVQVVDLHADPVRHAVMVMTVVIVRAGLERACERIDPGARADAGLAAIQA